MADDGPGMSAEDRERAFLRFTTSNPNGTGLGLAIVHRLVTSNGGTARLTETPGGGLTVLLDFPGGPAAGTPLRTTALPGRICSACSGGLARPALVGRHQYPCRKPRVSVWQARNTIMIGFRFGNEQAR